MGSTSKQYTAELAAFAHSLTFDQIPDNVITSLKAYLFDAAGSMLVGSLQPSYQYALKAVKATHGEPKQGYHAIDGSLSTLSGATLLNGVATGNFEFEHVIVGAHPGSSFLPALLTFANDKMSGKDFLTAMAIGYEVSIRIGYASTAAVEHVRGFHNPGLNGSLATAASIGRLIGLDAKQIASAMGIAASSSAGLMAFASCGAMTKQLHPARSAQLGVEAAFMAQAGLTGPEDILENPHGFLHAFSPEPQIEKLTEGLGTKWDAPAQIAKFNPVHAHAQAVVYAINSYRDQGNTWTAADISDVKILGSSTACSPRHGERKPNSLIGAQYSVVFSVATALGIDLRNPLALNDKVLKDAGVLSIAEKITAEVDPDLPRQVYGSVALKIKGTPVLIKGHDYPGLPGAPGYFEAIDTKFQRVVESLGVKSQGLAFRQAVDGLAESKDGSAVTKQLLSAGVACQAYKN